MIDPVKESFVELALSVEDFCASLDDGDRELTRKVLYPALLELDRELFPREKRGGGVSDCTGDLWHCTFEDKAAADAHLLSIEKGVAA